MTKNRVKLLDGREVSSSSEDWRHECEAVHVAGLPTLAERRGYLSCVEQNRGKKAADRLRETITQIFNQREKRK